MDKLIDGAAPEGVEHRVRSASTAGCAQNNAIFCKHAQVLGKSAFECMVTRLRAKIKALKKYKAITDRMRRSGAGNESDEDEEIPIIYMMVA